VIQNLLATLRVELRGVVTTLICAAVAASAALVGVLFIAVAIFIWASENYGRLTAAIAMAVFFIAVAAIAVVVLLMAQSKARKAAEKQAEKERLEKEEAAKNAPPAWMDPALIPTLLPLGIKAMQIGLKHRGVLLALVSSVALGWAMLRERGKPDGDAEDAAAEQPAE
jgi:membrane protein implicated in regulation of membrane protease activity